MLQYHVNYHNFIAYLYVLLTSTSYMYIIYNVY